MANNTKEKARESQGLPCFFSLHPLKLFRNGERPAPPNSALGAAAPHPAQPSRLLRPEPEKFFLAAAGEDGRPGMQSPIGAPVSLG